MVCAAEFLCKLSLLSGIQSHFGMSFFLAIQKPRLLACIMNLWENTLKSFLGMTFFCVVCTYYNYNHPACPHSIMARFENGMCPNSKFNCVSAQTYVLLLYKTFDKNVSEKYECKSCKYIQHAYTAIRHGSQSGTATAPPLHSKTLNSAYSLPDTNLALTDSSFCYAFQKTPLQQYSVICQKIREFISLPCTFVHVALVGSGAAAEILCFCNNL